MCAKKQAWDDTKYLILNADDYGINEQSNAAIFELFQQKRITSASILTVGSRAKQAIYMAAEHDYPVGIHFAFNSDDEQHRWRSITAAPSLNDDKGLYHDAKKIMFRAKSAEISREMEAQYLMMVKSGCLPDHADSHCGTLLGVNGRLFFMNAFRFCRDHNIPFCMPKNHRFLYRMFDNSRMPALLTPFYKLIISIGEAMGVMLPDDMITNPHSIKKIANYAALRAFYLEQLQTVQPGITNLFLHPSYAPGFLNDPEDEWTKRDYELRLLLSGDLQQAAQDAGIQLVSWQDAPFRVKGKVLAPQERFHGVADRRFGAENRRHGSDRRQGLSGNGSWDGAERRSGLERRQGCPDRRQGLPDRRQGLPNNWFGEDRRVGISDRRRGENDRRVPKEPVEKWDGIERRNVKKPPQ